MRAGKVRRKKKIKKNYKIKKEQTHDGVCVREWENKERITKGSGEDV